MMLFIKANPTKMSPYINRKEVELVELKLPEELEQIKKLLESSLKKLELMKANGLINLSRC